MVQVYWAMPAIVIIARRQAEFIASLVKEERIQHPTSRQARSRMHSREPMSRKAIKIHECQTKTSMTRDFKDRMIARKAGYVAANTDGEKR
jgi:hypothetical protein